MTPTTDTPQTNGKDPISTQLEAILARLENVEANTEEILEKLQDVVPDIFGGSVE